MPMSQMNKHLVDFNEFIAPHGLEACFEIFRLNYGNRIESASFWSRRGNGRILFEEPKPLEEGYQVKVTTSTFWINPHYFIWLFLFPIDEDHTLVLRHREVSSGADLLFWILLIYTIQIFFMYQATGFWGALIYLIGIGGITRLFYPYRYSGYLHDLEKEIQYLLIDKPYP
jgi:hypothetical protein